jgi:predicted aspartyl protease
MTIRAIAMGVLILVSTLQSPSSNATTLHRHTATAGVATIAVKVNGISVRMLVDTAAQRSCLDAGLLAKLGVESKSSVTVTTPYEMGSARELRVRMLEIASFHVEDVPMIVMDMSPLSSASEDKLDGILGTDVLKLFPLKLEVSDGLAEPLTLSKIPSGSVVVELHEIDGLFYCATIIQGVPIHLLLDTGANLSNISSAAWDRVTATWEPRSVIRGIRSSGGPGEASLVLVPSLTLAGTKMHDVAMRVQPPMTAGLYTDQNFDGLLGTNFLESYSVILDLAHSRMMLSPQRKEMRESLRFSTVGIQFVKDTDGAFKIMAVWTPSPAAVAGLKIGDRILEVNGSDPRHMTVDELSQRIHQRPGTKVQLLIDSHGSVHLADMKIQCLFCIAEQSETGKAANQ